MGKTSIRRGVFETNSSSTHSITICKKEDYDAWREGKILMNPYSGETESFPESPQFMEAARNAYEDQKKEYFADWENLSDNAKQQWYTLCMQNEDLEEIFETYKNPSMQTYDEYKDENDDLEMYSHRFTTPSGDKMVAFGYHGYC